MLLFHASCLIAGLTIALDAAALLLSKFRTMTSIWKALGWALAVGFTHVAFPLVGFGMGYYVLEHYPLAAPIVYGVAAILLFLLRRLILRESVEGHVGDARPSVPPDVAAAAREGAGPPRTLAFSALLAVAVRPVVELLGVSYDALLSGPGKTPLIEIFGSDLAIASFYVIGAWVFLFTLAAGIASWRLHRNFIRGEGETNRLAITMTLAVRASLVLFSCFFWLCLTDLASWGLGQAGLPQIHWGLGVALGVLDGERIFRKNRSAIVRAQTHAARETPTSTSAAPSDSSSSGVGG